MCGIFLDKMLLSIITGTFPTPRPTLSVKSNSLYMLVFCLREELNFRWVIVLENFISAQLTGVIPVIDRRFFWANVVREIAASHLYRSCFPSKL